MSLEYLLSLECFFNSALIQNIIGACITNQQNYSFKIMDSI